MIFKGFCFFKLRQRTRNVQECAAT